MSNYKSIFKTIYFCAFFFLLLSCEGRREFPELIETNVSLDFIDIILITSGESITVTPKFEPNILPSRMYSWSVDDSDLATLVSNDDGSVDLTATGSGRSIIRVTSQDGSLTAEAPIRVISAPPVNITDQAEISVNRENNGGPEAGEGSPKLVDGDTGTKFLSDYRQPYTMTLTFDEPLEISFYQLTSANDAPSRDPKDWEIQGSMDGVKWDVLDIRQEEVFEERNMTREFFFDNATAYLHYRFDVINNNGSSLFQMSEWALLSVPE